MVRDCLTIGQKSPNMLAANNVLFVPKRQIEVRFLMKSGLILQDSCDIANLLFQDFHERLNEGIFRINLFLHRLYYGLY